MEDQEINLEVRGYNIYQGEAGNSGNQVLYGEEEIIVQNNDEQYQ